VPAVIAQQALGVVLLCAALGKLREPTAVRATFRSLGVGALAPAGGRGLPALELLLGAALLSGSAARLAACVAAGLLATFTVLLARVRGTGVRCACFGAGGGAMPVGGLELLRNTILSGLTVVAMLPGGVQPRVASLVAGAGVAATGALVLATVRLLRVGTPLGREVRAGLRGAGREFAEVRELPLAGGGPEAVPEGAR